MAASRRRCKAILFDWDGTLVDTYHSTFRAYSRSLAEFGIELSEQEFTARYTPHWNHFYAEMNLHADHWEKASEKWQYYFGQESIKLMPGARALLECLKREGYRLGVVTATSRHRLIAEMEAFEVQPLFEVWICNEDVTHKKPHPQALRKAAQGLNLTTTQCLYVGDAIADVAMAQRCRMPICAVLSQFNTVEAIERLRPDYLIPSLELLPLILRRSLYSPQSPRRSQR